MSDGGVRDCEAERCVLVVYLYAGDEYELGHGDRGFGQWAPGDVDVWRHQSV